MDLSPNQPDWFQRLRYAGAGLFRSYAEIFFLSDPVAGFCFFLATMLQPNIGLSGLLAVASARGFARLVHLDQRFVWSGIYTYNPLLVGLAIGSIYTLSWLSAAVIVSASALTFLLTVTLVQTLRYYLHLPALSLPFVATSIVVYLASLRYANLFVHAGPTWSVLDFSLRGPACVSGFLKSLGAIFLLPHELTGLLFSLVLVSRSRILFGLALFGYFTGTLLRGTLTGSYERAFADLSSFNFILIAMAIGGVFLVPSWNSLVLAAIAVCISSLILDAVQLVNHQFGIPAYTLPFNFVTLGLLYTLGSTHYPLVVQYFGATPEDTLENDLVYRARFPGTLRALELPFFGRWMVWQAFNDEWTHKGAWQYAYDFVIADEEGKVYCDTGMQLKDYYCFRKPVLSPCRGRVVKVVNHLPDNPVGRVDKTNNWGNLVVLFDERGFYVELSHFAEGSIKVQAGEWVESGQHLGLCGNSGYSPQPHIHMHVQLTDHVGSQTLPFSFARYLSGEMFFANDLPRKGAVVERAGYDEKLDRLSDFLLNEQLDFDIYERGSHVGEWSLTVRMALDGSLCFETERGDRLYFGKVAGTLYCYRRDGRDPLLGMVMQLLPRLPFVRRERLAWTDHVPLGLVLRGPRRIVSQMLAPFAPMTSRASTWHRFIDRQTVETTIRIPLWNIVRSGRVILDSDHGFVSLKLGDTELRRKIERSEPAENDVSPADQLAVMPAGNVQEVDASEIVALQQSE